MPIFDHILSGNEVTGDYQYNLVFLSFCIALMASFTALNLAIKTGDEGLNKKLWIYGSAFSMGGGIWSMHFTAMLACKLPVEVTYDIGVTLLSFLIVVTTSGWALFYANTKPFSNSKVISSGIVMGSGVAIMHYLGMSAIEIEAQIYYRPLLFVLSIIIAIVASTVAIWLNIKFGQRGVDIKVWHKLLCAMIMAIAVCGMHYTGMAATNFASNVSDMQISHSGIDNQLLAFEVAGVTFLILAITLFAPLILSEISRVRFSTESRLRAILSNSLDGVISIDNSGKILIANPAIETLFGYTRKELIGKNITVLMPGQFRDLHSNGLKNYLLTGNKKVIGQLVEVEGLKKNGDIFPMELAISEYVWEEQKMFIGTIRDITERRRVEDQLKSAKNEAEKASRAKSEFLSRMSHELRTPMNAILGFTQLMQMDPKNPLTDSQNLNLQQVSFAGKHLLELINEVLDLARVESGQLRLLSETIDIAPIVKEVISLSKPLADQQNVTIEFQDMHGGRFLIDADMLRFKQILINLVSNAIKYNKPQGSVVVSIKEYEKTKTQIMVRDTGKGISEENQKQLFAPFERFGDNTEDIEGSGIGLTISKKLVEAMGGEIGYESVLGEGSVFHIDFPPSYNAFQADAEKASNVALSQLNGKERRRVLYIEDIQANIELVKQILICKPHVEFISSLTPKGGIELAVSETPDLILMDIHMAEMDGLTAFKKLNSINETKDIPVIALTADAMDADIKRALNMGFKDYITKPIDVPKFLNVVEEILQ
jgi:PAS domain S-box-containing protein